MTEFFLSLGVFGWSLIAICVAILAGLPRLLRGGGKSRLPDSHIPTGQPPDYRGFEQD
jgi:hypothetical protein